MSQSHQAIFTKFVRPALLAASLFAVCCSSFGQDKSPTTTMPDAQVEANVLKAFAGAPQLSDQRITMNTVYGVVTLSGFAKDESTRVLAETIASHTEGVRKVIDELALGTGNEASNPASPDQGIADVGSNPNLQSDGTIASGSNQQPANQPPDQGNYGATAPPPPPQQPNAAGAAPAYARPYPQQPYPQQSNTPAGNVAAPAPYGAQLAGQPVVIPGGSMLRIRINEGLDSKHAQPGSIFDGVVLNDVVADGAVAIPRGAAIQGTVVDAKPSGALNGRGELSLQLTQVTLGGRIFPLLSDKWSSVGADKTGQTVGNAVGLGAVGALIGAFAGGGAGAVLGAGLGGAAGLGASAASNNGQALIPPEAILTFHLAQQAAVTTVSQAEMDRLSSGVPLGAQHLQRRPPPPPPYYGPGYYPSPYYPPPY